MSSTLYQLNDLAKRQTCRYYGYGYSYNDNCYSRWDTWGRWVLLACIIVAVLLVFFLFSCITARRRRKHGQTPYRGTAWMAPQHGNVNYYGPGGANTTQQPAYYAQNDAAPPYQTANAGYYGQQSGYEMQAPQQTYQPAGRGGDGMYAPPSGPPPNKN